MRHDQFKHIFDEGRIRRIEFYGKVLEWHTRWTNDTRTLYHLTLYRWPFLQVIHTQLQKIARSANAQAAKPSN